MAMRQDASTGQMVDDGKATDESGKPLMQVKVYAPFKVYFDGPAYSISGLNQTGPFDILPKHHNFISVLLPCELVIHSPNGSKSIRISQAVMHVKADKVVVFVDV